MTMDEVQNRLLGMKAKAERAQKLLGQDRLSAAAKEEIEQLARELKEELRGEFKRLSPGRSQETFTRAESAYYWPSIHEAWVAISGLRVDGRAKKAWYNHWRKPATSWANTFYEAAQPNSSWNRNGFREERKLDLPSLGPR